MSVILGAGASPVSLPCGHQGMDDLLWPSHCNEDLAGLAKHPLNLLQACGCIYLGCKRDCEKPSLFQEEGWRQSAHASAEQVPALPSSTVTVGKAYWVIINTHTHTHPSDCPHSQLRTGMALTFLAKLAFSFSWRRSTHGAWRGAQRRLPFVVMNLTGPWEKDQDEVSRTPRGCSSTAQALTHCLPHCPPPSLPKDDFLPCLLSHVFPSQKVLL